MPDMGGKSEDPDSERHRLRGDCDIFARYLSCRVGFKLAIHNKCALGAGADMNSEHVKWHTSQTRRNSCLLSSEPSESTFSLLRERPTIHKRIRITLSPEQREQLLQRLTQGARNAELADEFGLTKQQVQGIRMGSARQIAKMHHTVGEHEEGSGSSHSVSSSIDEIVRYLRQQDDVVSRRRTRGFS
jgi:hypothetical protein